MLVNPLTAVRNRPRASVVWVEDADHSFHVPARTGRTDEQVLAQVLDTLAGWIDANR